jgi:hypothetical protein
MEMLMPHHKQAACYMLVPVIMCDAAVVSGRRNALGAFLGVVIGERPPKPRKHGHIVAYTSLDEVWVRQDKSALVLALLCLRSVRRYLRSVADLRLPDPNTGTILVVLAWKKKLPGAHYDMPMFWDFTSAK